MQEFYCKVSEAPKRQATPYDHFCSRDSRLLSEIFAEGQRAGIKEVVEWIEYYLNMPETKGTYVDKIIRPQLKSKLKEWGLRLGLESDIELE